MVTTRLSLVVYIYCMNGGVLRWRKKSMFTFLVKVMRSMRNLLGGKGANLAEMTILGIPVPQGFIVTTEACNKYYEDGKQIAEEL